MSDDETDGNFVQAELPLGNTPPVATRHSAEDSGPENGLEKSPWAALIECLVRVDLAIVFFVSRSARCNLGRRSAIIISKLGNGWIYPLLGLVVFEWLGAQGERVIIVAGVNAGLLHCLYPYVKRRIGRPRPFRIDPALSSLFGALDEYSFPSGHAMTLSGVLAPIVFAWPSGAMLAIALTSLMGWARIASGHHYPSDVLAGVAMGLALAYPLSLWALAG